jgi:glycosyltransferase involved in cell wall biosynthesis
MNIFTKEEIKMNKFNSKPVPKILMVGPMPPLIGGIATHISDLLNSNLNDNFDLIPFTTSRPSNKNKISSVHNYRVISDFPLVFLIKCIIITAYHLLLYPFILIKQKPNLVHVHSSSYWSFWENSFYVLIAKLLKNKVVLHIHGSDFDDFYSNSPSMIKKYIYYIMKNTNKVISLSEYWHDFFINVIGINKNNVVIIRNGVMSSKYRQKKEDCSLDRNVEVLFIGGKDSKRKGAYEVVKAIPIVLSSYSNVTFTFIGTGQIEEIKKMCEDLDIDKNVKLMGQVSEEQKIESLSCSDIYLLPSYAEGLPISVLEAMAASLPIISTPVGGIPEVIEEGINGYLIEPGDYESLANKILLLVENEDLRARISSNNSQKIKSMYDISVVVERLRNTYCNAMDMI